MSRILTSVFEEIFYSLEISLESKYEGLNTSTHDALTKGLGKQSVCKSFNMPINWPTR